MLLFRRYFGAKILTALTIFLSVLIIFNTSVYFQPEADPPFLVEKGDLVRQPLWKAAFYFHVVSSCICLAVGAALMFPAMLRFRRMHFLLGYIYLNAVLWIAAPTGLILAFTAKGGAAAGIGFAVTGIFWWMATWLGYRAIRNHDLENHIRWMIRSYALALSAPAFRVVQLLLVLAPIEYELNYILSVWLSLLISVALSEICIHKNLKTDRIIRSRFLNYLKGRTDESLSGHPAYH